jgi:hypothetical protein
VQHVHLHGGLELREGGLDLPAQLVQLGEIVDTSVTWRVRNPGVPIG